MSDEPQNECEDAALEDEIGGDRVSMPILSLLPNLVTLIGLSAGLTSIRYVLQENYQVAAALLVVAALIDGLDGLLARKLNAASHFGAELDSLSDFLCFGVAPGIFIYHFTLHSVPGLGWVFVLVYALSACLRLARFNVSRNAPAPQGVAHFVGVPAPAGAMLALFPVFLALAGWFETREWPILVAIYLGGVGVLMISRVPTPSPKAINVPRNRAIWVLMGVAVVVGALATRPWAVLALLCVIYLAVLLRQAWARRSTWR
ncbi:CDP-diacylglycerol--serine O-phosphatidyltransferase [Pararhodobacter oceanensis]|uniref:CDP-diacylglycerol--serine O-phosphatidyltransferase n=1 Tax=Pararhodobacter oceanensis TaxID=2172121 RepID=UPI003A92B635